MKPLGYKVLLAIAAFFLIVLSIRHWKLGGRAEELERTLADRENSGGSSLSEIEKKASREIGGFARSDEAEYLAVYDDPFVKHLRTALDGYLSGTNEGMLAPGTTASATSVDGELTAGLDSFSKAYYRSKFVVVALNPFVMGGKEIGIIFQDRPDKVFSAWVYGPLKTGGYDLKLFWEQPIAPADLDAYLSRQKELIEDREHSL